MSLMHRGILLTDDQVQKLVTLALDHILVAIALPEAQPRVNGHATNGHAVNGHAPAAPTPARRGPRSPAMRARLSRQMKARWKARRAAGKAGRLDT